MGGDNMNYALGIVEVVGFSAAVQAADAAVKAAKVTLLGYEPSKGSGMVTVKLVGDVGAVDAAVTSAANAAQKVSSVFSHLIIPKPSEEITALLKAKKAEGVD